MPFRCKCGRTFEKTDSFSSHTSSCAPFHHRRLSDTTIGIAQQTNPVTTAPLLPIMMNRPDNHPTMLSTSVPENVFFMPTALSIQNAFEDATRRKSTSQESELKQ